jgi:ankyrin repeat protein
MLLDAGADVGAVDEDGVTVVISAAAQGHFDVLRYVLVLLLIATMQLVICFPEHIAYPSHLH